MADFKKDDRVDVNKDKISAKVEELKDGSQPEVVEKLNNYLNEQKELEKKAMHADTTKRAMLQSQMLFVWFC